MGGWAAALAALSTLLATAAGAPATPSVSLSASFVLKTIDPQGSDTVSGDLSFIPGGEVCVAVKTPTVQEMRLSLHELVIYYPTRDLAFVAHLEPTHPPPMLDALAAGMVDPGSTLPRESKLLERKAADGTLTTRWRVVAGTTELGEMRTVESRAGALSIELRDKAGQPQRRFTFADRVRVGAHSIPRSIVADYFAAGAQKREERWSLGDVAPADPRRPAQIGCARLGPRTKIQALAW
ncbi:MAG TPA: hypothetical protein VHO06_13385 [Polyangia bacterium]|nr:hypothetical protein [Polyangia bacterium]